MSEGPEWFAQKRYGYGAGLPIAWQGWVLLAAYFAVMIGAGLAVVDRPALMIAIMAIATILVVLVAARTTRGGWRWHWGKGEEEGAGTRRRSKADRRGRSARGGRRNVR